MEEKDLLQRALSEINSLRKSNERMKLRLDMFDDVMSALHGKPGTQQSGGMSLDIAYEIEKYLSQK